MTTVTVTTSSIGVTASETAVAVTPTVASTALTVAATRAQLPAGALVVAASTWTGYADYRGSGVADDAPIQAALDAAPAVALTAGTFAVSATLRIPPGTALTGQGQDATTLVLAAGAQIVLQADSRLAGVTVQQSGAATAPAIYATDTASDANAHRIILRDVTITGGVSTTWAAHFRNPYEFLFENLFVSTSSNGIWLETTNDHLYNPGDGVAVKVQIRLQSAGTTALRLSGQKAYGTDGHYGGPSRYIANTTWLGFYATAGDRAGWASEGHTGIEITNAPKHRFYGCNLEELQTNVALSGQVNSGTATYAISFADSWLAGPLTVGSGTTDVQLLGTRLDEAPSGANVARVQFSGTDVATGSSEPFVKTPHYRGAYGGVVLSLEVPVTNSSGASISNNRVCKWTGAGAVAAMTSADPWRLLAGVTFGVLADGQSGHLTAAGIQSVGMTGSVSQGDYIGIDPSSAGKGISLGTSPGSSEWIGIAQQGGTGNIPVRLRLG